MSFKYYNIFNILQVIGNEPFTFIFVNIVGIPRMYAAF